MAGGTGGTAVSPRPCTSAPGTSITRWRMEPTVQRGGDVVVGEVRVGHLPVGELELLEQRGAEAEDHRALVLQLGAVLVDHLAGVRGGVERGERDDAGLRVDVELGRGGALVPVGGRHALAGVGVQAAFVGRRSRARRCRGRAGLARRRPGPGSSCGWSGSRWCGCRRAPGRCPGAHTTIWSMSHLRFSAASRVSISLAPWPMSAVADCTS